MGESAVLTQCDVKNRWPDGSLKFAIVSFLVPALPGNGSVQVTFQDQSTGNNTGYLDSNGMLDSAFDFDGLIHLDNGAGIQRNISARAMLSAGKFTYWLQGPIVTAVRLADETTRAYDVNVDGGTGNPLHPIFEAWFYPSNRKVDIGYTVENAWMSNTAANSTRDQTYSFTLCAGNSNCSGNNPVLAFTQPLFTQIGWSRWHKDYWVKGPPSPIRIDFNSAYLLSTQTLPNYNVNRDVSAAATKYIQTWTSMPAAQKSLTGTPGSCRVGRVRNDHRLPGRRGAEHQRGRSARVCGPAAQLAGAVPADLERGAARRDPDQCRPDGLLAYPLPRSRCFGRQRPLLRRDGNRLGRHAGPVRLAERADQMVALHNPTEQSAPTAAAPGCRTGRFSAEPSPRATGTPAIPTP